MTTPTSSDKKLFLLDAFALIYRAYFAFSKNPRVNSKGMNTSAIFGFVNTLLDVLKREKPTHIAVVFDTAEPTQRHEEFSDYKANRQEVPEDITIAVPYIKKLLEGFRIPVIELAGYEADDLIGTLAKKAEINGFKTYMMTPDKDFGQLVTDHVFIYKPARLGNGAEVMGKPEVCERWQIQEVSQVIDILGLMGDAVDNIPGVPGVGEKTAIQLIKDYGSVENLLQNTSALKGKLKEKVEENKALAIQSKRLATIITDAPVELNEDALKLEDPDKEVLKNLFAELEFKRLGDQLGLIDGTPITQPVENTNGFQADLFSGGSEAAPLSEEAPAQIFKTILDTPHNYILVENPESRKALIDLLLSKKEICFDTETTDLDVSKAELVGLAFSIKPGEGYYVPVPADQGAAKTIAVEFKGLLEHPGILKIGQNLKYDMAVMRNYGIEIKAPFFDTMIAHYLIQPDMRHNMDLLSETYLGYAPVSIETLIGKKGKSQGNMRDAPIQAVAEYAAEDADITLQLKQVFLPMLSENGVSRVFQDVEIPLMPVLLDMEQEGIHLDKEVLRVYSSELEEEIKRVDKEIQTLGGTPFNVSSPKQVGQVIYEILKIVEKPKKTKTGQYATGEDVLQKLSGKHVIIDKILEYRELVKLKNTYVDVLPELINPKTGRLHTSFNQVVAATGRLSSDNPNLQNIPIRTEKGREIRKAFIPRNSDFVLLSADYSQIELRIMAGLSGDPAMCEAFKSGQDIHAATAARVFGVELSAVTSEHRRKAKMVNFGIIYGISAFGLADRLNIPRAEAKEIIETYFKQYPGIRDFMDKAVEGAKAKGFVETVLGRRRYLKDIHSANFTVRGFAERNAINAPIQGSAADMIKLAMIGVHKELNQGNFKSKMLLQVHDELVFDLHRNEVEQVQSIVKEQMEKALDVGVPVLVEMGTGENWLQAH